MVTTNTLPLPRSCFDPAGFASSSKGNLPPAFSSSSSVISSSSSVISSSPSVFSSSSSAFSSTSSAFSSSSSRLQHSKNKRGSFGCTREVLHPLDPEAEPTAPLHYDPNCDEDYLDGQQILPTPSAINRRFLPIGPDMEASRKAAVDGPKHPQDPVADSIPMHASLHDINQSLLSKLSSVAISDVPRDSGRMSSQTPERSFRFSVGKSYLSHAATAHNRSPQSSLGKKEIFGFIEDWGEEALIQGIYDFLEEVRNEPEGTPLREVINRVECFIESLKKFAPRNNEIEYIIDQYTKHKIIPEGKSNQLKEKCKRTAKLTAAEILCRWLVSDRVFRDEDPITEGSTLSHRATSVKQNPGLSPNRKSFFSSPSNPRGNKSVFAENMAIWEEKLQRLRDSADAFAETLKQNARREHENSVRYMLGQYKIGGRLVKEETSLESRLQKLLDEKRHQEQLALQAKQEEQRRRQEEARRKAEEEEARKRAAEAEHARRKAAEEATKRAEIERQRQAEALRRQKQQEEEERKKEVEAKAAVEAARRKQEEEKKAQQANAMAVAAAVSAGSVTTQFSQYGRKSLEIETACHLELLSKLKEIRKQINADRELYKKVNVVKRALNPKLGQLNGEIAQTTAIRTFIYKVLCELLESNEGPRIEASHFQISRDPRIPAPAESTRVPVIFIWMINEIGKMVVRQVEAESAVDIKTANPIGVCIVSALARQPLIVDGLTFIDIIIARLWKKCPIIQGKLGPEETVGRKEALGWKREGDTWETEEAHVNRMNGYVAGFASIAGRNFMKSAMNNPYPPFNLWFILAHFANNADKLTNTHFYCIKTMLEVAGDTLKSVYKTPGTKLINLLLTDLADYGVKQGMGGAIGLQALKAKVEKEGKFLG